MRVFLSWSGAVSHSVALAFRGWLPSVIQSLEPYVSSEDIDKGARWSTEMAQELEKSRYGIICVTKENVNKPWINFEAGALSRSIEKATAVPFSSAVSPFLFGLKSTDFEGPLTSLVWITSLVSIAVTYGSSVLLIGDMGNGLWWKLSTIISCGTPTQASSTAQEFPHVSAKWLRAIRCEMSAGSDTTSSRAELAAARFCNSSNSG